MNILNLLKAIADETRLELLTMLLKNSCCVRALARRLGLTEATVSGHLRILREAGLLTGEKRGYFTYYTVNRNVLCELAGEFEALSAIKLIACTPERAGCESPELNICRDANKNCNNCNCNCSSKV